MGSVPEEKRAAIIRPYGLNAAVSAKQAATRRAATPCHGSAWRPARLVSCAQPEDLEPSPMALTLHNTLSRTREPFVPADPQRVTMYVCGPTVYNFAHIGNARPPVVFDVLARLLRRRYALTYVRN